MGTPLDKLDDGQVGTPLDKEGRDTGRDNPVPPVGVRKWWM